MPEKMNRFDYIAIFTLTLVVSIISFARLGDMHAPQTSWLPDIDEHALIDFGEVITLSEIQFRMGSRHDRGFILRSSNDAIHWETIHTVTGANVFYWTSVPVAIDTRFILVTAMDVGLRLQEIAFRDADGAQITHFGTSENALALTDEQHLVPERRSFMNSTYFDEIYHPRTGYEFVHGLPVYETTHPPMGKNFIAMSVYFFGMTPFAWRLPGTLFGVLMVPLLYAFARLLFRDNRWALFAAFIFAFDFMRFAQTRLATIDTYVTFFVLAMYYFMYRYIREVDFFATATKEERQSFLRRSLPLLLACGVMMGLAIASKWQGVYGAVGLPILFFPALYKLYKNEPRQSQKCTLLTFASCFVFFIIVPLVIYTLSYIPFILAQGGGLQSAWDNQNHMFSYHAWLVEEHSFGSNWWSWPLMLRPIWIYVNRISPEVNAGMTSFGNPAIWWGGVGVTVVAIHAVIKRKHGYIPIFLLVAYAVQFLPWAFVSRLTFIYHYFPSVPFIVLLITWFFKTYANKRWMIISYMAVVLGLFILFYPVLSGLPMNPWFVRTFLAWLPGWVFM